MLLRLVVVERMRRQRMFRNAVSQAYVEGRVDRPVRGHLDRDRAGVRPRLVDEHLQRQDPVVARGPLQTDESIEALLKTAETVMKKYVLPSNFITKDIALDITGRRDRLELRFKKVEDRDRALEILNARAV